MVYYEEQLVRPPGCRDVTHTNIGIPNEKYITNCVGNHYQNAIHACDAIGFITSRGEVSTTVQT
jgi:hypothetical protein